MINLALGLGISISIFLYQKPYFLSIMEEHFLVQNSQDLCLLQDFFLTSFHQKVFKSLAKKTVVYTVGGKKDSTLHRAYGVKLP